MGSGSSRSSQVHSFQIDHANTKDSRPVNRVGGSFDAQNFQPRRSLKSPVYNEELERQSDVSSFTTSPTKRDALIVQLKTELGESESYNLDLQDRIQMLEEQICNLQTQNEIKEQEDNVEGTVKAKDQIIEKVTKEKAQLQQEMNKLKMRYKKRIKLLTSQVNEARQETSIQMFELRDEINRLTEENHRLNAEKSKEGDTVEDRDTDFLSTSMHGNSQMKIVLELSNQISEQENRLVELESQVRDRDELLKLHGISTEQINKKRSVYSNNEHIKQEKDAMRKLSHNMFPGANSDNVSEEENIIFSGDDNRGVSGASRDSGIGSAGKNGRTAVKSKHTKKQLSPLDDSDDSWESDTPLSSRDQNKIKSAPLETQYKRAASRNEAKMKETEEDCYSIDYDMQNAAKSAKLKKKSSFKQRLRKENESSIRTPIPYEAFGGDENRSKQGYMKTKSHFFLTQTSSQASTPTNEIDALLMS